MTSTVIVDAMGGDFPLNVPVQAAIDLCNEHNDLNIILTGSEAEIKSVITGRIPSNFSIVNAEDEILMNDPPTVAFRKKQNSSVHKAVELLVNNEGDAFFSAGNTGAIVATAFFKSGLLPGISRPALATVYPSATFHKLIVLDLGATIEPKPENIKDYAILGSAYSFLITGKEEPVVGILNVGTEENKGSRLVVESAELIRKATSLNFIGFVEGNQIFVDSCADVVVTDAFTGNIALKTVEGLNETIHTLLKSKIAPPKWGKVGSFFFKRIFGETLSKFQYNLYGAALLLGVNHLIGIGHGKSEETAYKNAILRLKKHIESQFIRKFKEKVDKELQGK
ncbi:MAG TPA: phosphate acyltransferase PlsX [bacterium]|nr:phosphate acyltransferase PlsX [bacterium]